jgi:hypothetical protein
MPAPAPFVFHAEAAGERLFSLGNLNFQPRLFYKTSESLKVGRRTVRVYKASGLLQSVGARYQTLHMGPQCLDTAF